MPIETLVVSAVEEPFEEVVEVGGRRVLKRLPPQKAYTTCTIHASTRGEGVLLFAVCRPGPPGKRWVKRKPPLVIPHQDFATCNAELYMSKYKLGENISRVLEDACKRLREKYAGRLM